MVIEAPFKDTAPVVRRPALGDGPASILMYAEPCTASAAIWGVAATAQSILPGKLLRGGTEAELRVHE